MENTFVKVSNEVFFKHRIQKLNEFSVIDFYLIHFCLATRKGKREKSRGKIEGTKRVE